MIADDTNFFIANNCPECWCNLASNAHYLYEKKAWCSGCGKRYLLSVVGTDKNDQYIFTIEREYE
jgi:hypothetical protein